MKKILLAYIPVLHQGYIELFARHSNVKEFWILDREITNQVKPHRKDIRAIAPEKIAQALESWQLFEKVKVAKTQDLASLNTEGTLVVMPDEVLLHSLAKEHFPNAKHTFDTIFLMWDQKNIVEKKKVTPHKELNHQDFMQLARNEASQSADWWRHVGAVVVKDGTVLLKARNTHLPSDHEPYIHGDPRASFSKGVNIELGTAIHAEAGIIAQAAKQGISLEGCELYVTDFPCPPCAKLVAHSGIKTVYFEKGYSVLDGEDVLRDAGVEVVRVK